MLDAERGVREPATVVDGRGRVLVAWLRGDAVRAATVQPDGTVRRERVAGGSRLGDLRLAGAPGGDAVLAWRQGGRVVVARRSGGGTFARPVPVSAQGARTAAPAAAVGEDGPVLVAWQQRGSRRGLGTVRVVRAPGRTRRVGRARVVTRSGGAPVLGAGPSGAGIVAYAGGPSARRRAVVARPVSPGGAVGAAQRLGAGRSGEIRPRLVVAPDGGAILGWRETTPDADAPAFAAVRAAGAARFGTPVRLAADITSLAPSVTIAEGGRWAATWQGSGRLFLARAGTLTAAPELQVVRPEGVGLEVVGAAGPDELVLAWAAEERDVVLRATTGAFAGGALRPPRLVAGGGRLDPDLFGRAPALATGGSVVAVAFLSQRGGGIVSRSRRTLGLAVGRVMD